MVCCGGPRNRGPRLRTDGGLGPTSSTCLQPDGFVEVAINGGVVKEGPLVTSPLDDHL